MWQFLALAAIFCTFSEVRAEVTQQAADPVGAPQGAQAEIGPESPSRFFDAEDGKLDFSSFLEHPRGFLPIPVIVTEPAVGYGGGGVGMFVRPREEAGDEGWARPDISAVGAVATQNGTRGGAAGDASRWYDGRLRTLVGGGTGNINLDFYGLGPLAPSLDQKVRYTLQFTAAVLQGNWQLADKSPWAVGVRYVYADVEPQLRDEPIFIGLADRIHIKVSAPTAIVEYDTRDNIFTPTRGVFSESSWLASRESLGASVDFERFEQILMGWHSLSPDWTLAARGNYAWSSSGTPFFLRPFVILRGVPAMRYQGDSMASVEGEVRWQFAGRWSIVGFGGFGAARNSRDGFSATRNIGSGGLGFRYELARKFGLHVGMDVAHSSGTTAVYLQVGNAWFRP